MTNKFSVKIRSHAQQRHRVAYLFNRTTNGTEAGPNGANGLPGAVQRQSQSTFDGDLHRVTLTGGIPHGEHLTVARIPSTRTRSRPTSIRTGRTRLPFRTPSIATRTWGANPVHRALHLGQRLVQRHPQPSSPSGRRHHDEWHAHAEGDSPTIASRPTLRPAGLRLPGPCSASADRLCRVTNFANAGGSSFARSCSGTPMRAGRDDPVSQADLSHYGVSTPPRTTGGSTRSRAQLRGALYEFTRPPVAGGINTRTSTAKPNRR